MYYNFNIKQINIVKQKKTISLNIHRFNYLPFLLHNFTGFLTLDVIIKNIHKGALSKNKSPFFQSRCFIMNLHKRLTCWFHLRKRPGAYPVHKYSGFIVCIL